VREGDANPALLGLAAEEVGFWANTKLGTQLHKDIMAPYTALGEPRTSMYGCADASDVLVQCPNVGVFFADSSVSSVPSGVRVVFKSK